MSPSKMRSVAGCALLALAAVSPSVAVTLSTLPAQPVERTPFTLVVGGTASCPALDTLKVQHRLVLVRLLLNLCPTPPEPFLLEIPIPPLDQGEWTFQILSGEQQLSSLLVNVEPVPFGLEVDPPSPQPGTPFTVRLTGSGRCPRIAAIAQDGNLITFLYDDNCQLEFVPPPEPFVIPLDMDPLPVGNYVVQAVDFPGETLASRRFTISDAPHCQPSETALCLLEGRYRVEVTWRTATAQGTAQTLSESDNFGAFSLTDPDHLEVFVGMLDACASPTHTVWVSTNGLTDAEVEITVTEMATGEVRRYDNPLGMRFAPIWDPMAFVCH
jgi:hypothetical protein